MATPIERNMELQRDFLISAGILVAVNLLLAFSAIGLFVRMSPVIDRILRENVGSLEAAQEMMSVLSGAAGEPVSEGERMRFERALDLASTNVTEPAEAPVVLQITRTRERALGGDHEALDQVVNQLSALVRVNHQAMREVDAEARRLGNAGAWVAVFLAFFSFVLSLWVVRRLRRRVIAPMVDIYEALEAVRQGDLHRRCRPTDGPLEIQRLSSSINLLLDGGLEGVHADATNRPAEAARGALVMLLEGRPASTVLVDSEGNIVAANGAGLDALNGVEGSQLRHAIARLPEAASPPATQDASTAEPRADTSTEAPEQEGTRSATATASDTPFDTVPLPGNAGWLLTIH